MCHKSQNILKLNMTFYFIILVFIASFKSRFKSLISSKWFKSIKPARNPPSLLIMLLLKPRSGNL